MPLGMEVGLGPGDFVLDGDPAPLRKKMTQPPPNFWPMSINVATVAYKSQLLLSYCLWAEVHNVSAIHSEMHPAYGDKCFIRPDRQHTRVTSLLVAEKVLMTTKDLAGIGDDLNH